MDPPNLLPLRCVGVGKGRFHLGCSETGGDLVFRLHWFSSIFVRNFSPVYLILRGPRWQLVLMNLSEDWVLSVKVYRCKRMLGILGFLTYIIEGGGELVVKPLVPCLRDVGMSTLDGALGPSKRVSVQPWQLQW